MEQEIQKYAVYRHWKGDYYYVLSLAEHESTGEILVIYHALYGEGLVWARNKEDFLAELSDEDFNSPLNKMKQQYRFELAFGFDE